MYKCKIYTFTCFISPNFITFIPILMSKTSFKRPYNIGISEGGMDTSI